MMTVSGEPRQLSYWPRRLLRHAMLALAALCIGAIVWPLSRHRSPAEGLSFATAYAGLTMFAAALALGPLNVLRRRSNPVSTDLRRDVGIWAGVCGIAHTVAGLQVHMPGRMLQYFVPQPGSRGLDKRTAAFVMANYLGLLGAVLLLLLLSLSNDIALRMLGLARWKLLQRSTYVVALAVAFHGSLYQLLESRRAVLVFLFGVVTIGVGLLQLAGARAELARTAPTRGPPEAEEGPESSKDVARR